MVATLLRLRLTLLRNVLRRSVWRMLAVIAGALYGLFMLAMLAAGLAALNALPIHDRTAIVVGAGALLVIGWALIPLLLFGVDDMLDPQRFALWVVPDHRFAAGLLAASVVSIPGVITALLALAVPLAWVFGPHGVWAVIAAAGCAPLGAGMCVLAARLTTTAASASLRSRRGRDVVGLVSTALVLLVSVLPLALSTAGGGVQGALAQLRRIVDILGWTPFGAPWAIPADIAAGQPALAAARLAGVLAALALGWWWWRRLLAASMTTVSESSAPSARRSGQPLRLAGAFARLPRVSGPTAAVAARCARYWRVDPRYLVSIASLIFVPVVVVAAMALTAGNPQATTTGPGEIDVAAAALPWVLAAFGPIFAVFGAWSLHNDVAYDSSAYWLHLSAGLPGRADRAGRVLGAAAWMVPLTIVLCLAGTIAARRLDLLPAALGLGLGVLGVGFGVSSVSSALIVYPVPPPGGNPMSSQSGAAVTSMVAMTVTSFAIAVAGIPLWLSLIPVFAAGPEWGWLTLVVGVALGMLVLVIGIRRGGDALDRRGADVLTAIQAWPQR